MSRVRVLLADDHAILRSGLRLLLEREPDMAVVGEATDGREAVDRMACEGADVVVMDVGMPGLNGVEATGQIVRRHPHAGEWFSTLHASTPGALPHYPLTS